MLQLAGLSPKPGGRLLALPYHPELSVSEALFTVLGYGVDHWQYHEELFMEQPRWRSLNQTTANAALLQQAQLLFGDLLVTLPPRPWQEALSWLDRELAWLDEAHALERLIAERGHYFKPLHCRDELLRALQARQQALPTLESFQGLLRSPLLPPNYFPLSVVLQGAPSCCLSRLSSWLRASRRRCSVMPPSSWIRVGVGCMASR